MAGNSGHPVTEADLTARSGGAHVLRFVLSDVRLSRVEVVLRRGGDEVLLDTFPWPDEGVLVRRLIKVPTDGTVHLRDATSRETLRPVRATLRQPGSGELAVRAGADYIRRRGVRNVLSVRTLEALRLALRQGGPVTGVANRLADSQVVGQGDRDLLDQYRSPDGAVDPKSVLRAGFRAHLDAWLAAGGSLRLPRVDQPRTSIVVVTWNSPELCLQALQSIALHGPADSETIVVDNGSEPLTQTLLDRLDGATVLRNEDNLGFLLACNQGVERSSGDVVVLLNSDAQLLPGAIEAAAAALSDPSIGVAGGPIVNYDGRLQEAGSIVWRDGSCAPYGRGQQIGSAATHVDRDVDFCSGAFLVVRRSLWDALGGFDERYAPAYYEDTDLCLRAWEAGHRVRYLRGAPVMHFEYGSSGSDDARSMMSANRATFAARHAATLADHRPFDERTWAAAVHHSARPRVLVVEDRVPDPSLGAGSPRAAAVIDALRTAAATVTVVCTDRRTTPQEVADRWRTAHPDVELLVVGVDITRVELEHRAGEVDVLWVSRPHNMADLGEIPARTDAAVVYDAEAVMHERYVAQAHLGDASAAAMADTMREIERQAVRDADVVVAVSARDATTLAGMVEEPPVTTVVGHALKVSDLPMRSTEQAGFGMLAGFTGNRSPNVDALRWFVRWVWPDLHERTGERLVVAGRGSRSAAEDLRTVAGLDVLGDVADVQEFYRRIRVVVVPTRFAAGVPWKAHEAAAHHRPMVVTPLIATQLGKSWTDAVEVADDPKEWVEACTRLIEERDLYEARRRAATDAVRSECAPTKILEGVTDTLDLALDLRSSGS